MSVHFKFHTDHNINMADLRNFEVKMTAAVKFRMVIHVGIICKFFSALFSQCKQVQTMSNLYPSLHLI